MQAPKKEQFLPFRQKGKKSLTRRQVRELNENLRALSEELFQYGRKVVISEWHYGLPAGTVGWVTGEWPSTTIFFEFMNGYEWNLHIEMSEKLQVFDEWLSEEELDQKIENFAGKKLKVSRKGQYED